MSMKIKCTLCNKEEVLDRDVIAEISDIINKHGLKAIYYVKLLNMMKGKCLDSDEHSFVFDDDFLNEIGSIVNKDKEDTSEIEKLTKENDAYSRELTELSAKIKEIRAKVDANDDRIKGLEKNRKEHNNQIIILTGAEDIKIWY